MCIRDSYYVFGAAGNELAHNKLEGPLSFVDGDYTVKVNNAAIAVKVEAGKTNEYQTATLSVKSGADLYYYVLDRNGTELGHNKVNAAMAFPEGAYSVKLANETRPVTLTACLLYTSLCSGARPSRRVPLRRGRHLRG